jgi:integrase
MPRITKRTVDALKPGEFAWDSELKGFGARRRGEKISYIVKYRSGHGRSARARWFLIGHHGEPWTPTDARKQANSLLLRIREGEDPAATREVGDKAETVSDLWLVYRTRHAVPSKQPRSVAEDDALARDYILPAFGKRKVRDLVRPDIASWHAGMFGKPARANRALALLKAMLNKAEEWGIRGEASNPALRVKKFKEIARGRYLSPDELARLETTLVDFETREACPKSATAIIRLLIFTGMRLGEVLTLKWSSVNFENGAISLPSSKTGPKTVPLPAPAQQVLAGHTRIKGEDLVFPGQVEGKPIQGIQKMWQRIRRAAGLDDVHIHDLRHGYATMAVQSGESLFLVGKVLGHRQVSTTERYAHLTANPLRMVAENTARKLKAAMTGEQAAVIPLHPQAEPTNTITSALAPKQELA